MIGRSGRVLHFATPWTVASHGQRSLMGDSPWGCKDLDTTEHAHINVDIL